MAIHASSERVSVQPASFLNFLRAAQALKVATGVLVEGSLVIRLVPSRDAR